MLFSRVNDVHAQKTANTSQTESKHGWQPKYFFHDSPGHKVTPSQSQGNGDVSSACSVKFGSLVAVGVTSLTTGLSVGKPLPEDLVELRQQSRAFSAAH